MSKICKVSPYWKRRPRNHKVGSEMMLDGQKVTILSGSYPLGYQVKMLDEHMVHVYHDKLVEILK